jgi:hypothetical protein
MITTRWSLSQQSAQGGTMDARGQIPMNSATPSAATTAPGAIEAGARAAAALTPAVGLLTLGAVMAAIAIFIALNYALGITDNWVGFLFLTYWGSVEQLKLEHLPKCILGALVGLLAAYGLQALPHLLGPAGFALALGVILVLVYCLIMGWWPIAINTCAMLFLTVVTIPVLQAGSGLLKLFPALGTGIAYFAVLAWIMNTLMKRSAAKQGTSPI